MKMCSPKLLSLNTYHYRRGGSEAVYFKHDTLFQQLGWETAVFAMNHPNNEPSPWKEFFADASEFDGDHSASEKLRMAGKVIYSLEARKKLKRLLSVFHPDVAHAHLVYHHLSPSVLALLHGRGVPTVMTAHDLKVACPAYKMLNKTGVCEKCKSGNLLHVALNRCIKNSLLLSLLIMLESSIHRLLGIYSKSLDRIVVPSTFYRDKFMEWGWPSEKLVYIPNFIQANTYQTQYEPGDYFLYFGRLAPEKGLHTLIRAAISAGVNLRIAGTGPIKDELTNLADGTAISFLGHLDGDSLWRQVRGARAVVIPSEWYENAPMSVLESYATGKIVIGARIGGIPEMLIDGKTGYTFESGDVEHLAGVLQQVNVLPKSTIKNMGEQAREYVSSTFTENRYVAETLTLYDSLGVKSNASYLNQAGLSGNARPHQPI